MYYDPNQFGKKKRTIHFQDGHKKPGSQPYPDTYSPYPAEPSQYELPSKPYTPNSGEYPPNKPTMQEEQQTKRIRKNPNMPTKNPDSYGPSEQARKEDYDKLQSKENAKKKLNEGLNQKPSKSNPYSKPLNPKDNIGPNKNDMGKDGPNPHEGGAPAKKPFGPKGPKSPGYTPSKADLSKYKQGLNKSKEPNQYSEKIK